MKHFFRELKVLLVFVVAIIGLVWATDYITKNDADYDGTAEYSLDTDGNGIFKGRMTSAGITNVGTIVQSGGNVALTGAYVVSVATSTNSTLRLGMAGVFSTLPTTGYPEATFAYQTSDHRMYMSTCTVVTATSWISNW